MRTITVTTTLAAPADIVWRAVIGNGQAFRLVTRGLLRFPATHTWKRPLTPATRITGRLWLGGVVPAWRHTIAVGALDHDDRVLVTDEHGGPLRRWRHTITVDPAGADHCLYSDRVEFDAGPLTSAAAPVVELFYRARQHRWRQLAPALAAAATVP